MYKCLECGNIFDEGEQKTYKEDCGEYWGSPCTIEFSGCPICSGSYEETKSCKICGGEFLKEELTGGICEDCIRDNISKDINKCYELGEELEKSTIKINCFLYMVFDEKEIENILLKELKRRINKETSEKERACIIEATKEILEDY